MKLGNIPSADVLLPQLPLLLLLINEMDSPVLAMSSNLPNKVCNLKWKKKKNVKNDNHSFKYGHL